jgi:hypothetical protein
LLDLIAVFLPQLETFTSRCQGFAAYLGPAPTQKEPLTNVPATPQGINSLYTLFAYLREREYRNTDNEIYNLSYPENIWTQGFLACVHGEDEDPTDPCYHDSRNDQVDALAYSLEDFSHPVDPGVPIEDDDAGFAPTLIAATPQERYQAFDLWYPNLYANNAAYEDYYSQIYDILDDSATENLAEKGWHKALGDWSLRMNVMAEDIRRRREDAGINSAEGRRLTALLNQIEEAQNRISLFRQDILNFRQAIEDLAAGYQDIDNFGGVAAGSLYSSNPTYVWNDSLGRHSVQVTVSDFVLATLKAYRRGCCTHCIKLINHSGSVTVTVIREDSPTEARLPGRALLWRFTYPRISCTASANYSYNSNPSLGGVTEH